MTAQKSNLSRFLVRSFFWAGLACLVILMGSMAMFHQSLQTHHLRYRLAPHEGETTPDLLGRTSRILRSRFQALDGTFGLRDVQINQESDDLLHVRFSTRADAEEVLFWVTLPARVRLSLLHPRTPTLKENPVEGPPEGYAVCTYTRYMYRLSRPGDLKTEDNYYLVAEEPVMEIDEFDHVAFNKVGLHQRTRLTFRFPLEKERQFHDVTALNRGRQMVMLIDDRLFFPPKTIREPVEGGAVQVEGYYYNPPLRKLVKVLSTPSLPGELVEKSHTIE